MRYRKALRTSFGMKVSEPGTTSFQEGGGRGFQAEKIAYENCTGRESWSTRC